MTNIDFISAVGNWYYLDVSKLKQSKIVRYNKALSKAVCSRHVVAKITDINQLKDYCATTGLDFDKFQDLTQKITLVNPTRVSVKSSSCDYIKISINGLDIESCCGDISDIPDDSIYFIRSGKKFLLPSNGKELDIRSVAGLIKSLKLNHKYIYGIKKRDMLEADENLQNGEDFLDTQFETFNQKKEFTFSRAHICNSFFAIIDQVNSKELIDVVSKYNYNSDEIIYNIFFNLGYYSDGYTKAKAAIDNRWNNIFAKIPMFFVVDSGKRTYPIVIEYLKEKLEK
jgi:hypothetical protein